MAQVVASPTGLSRGVHSKLSNVAESYLAVVPRLLLRQPEVFTAIVTGGAEMEGRFVDRWVAIASTR